MTSMKILVWIGTSAAVASAGLAAMSSGEPVPPALLAKVLAKAKGGDTIVLAAGDFGAVTIAPRTYTPAIRIDARQARFTGLVLRRVEGVEIVGGIVRSPEEQQFSVTVDFANNIRLGSMAIGGGRIGVAISRSQNIAVVDNDFAGTRSDGVNVAMSQHVRIERNACRDFKPIQAVYAADGKLIRDGDHPDCVQAWSAPGYPPTSDLTVVGNKATGFMQGIFVFNPAGGAENRPMERIVVKDNVLTLSAFNGIVLKNVHDSDVRGNVVNSVKGSVLQAYPYPPIKAWIRVTGTNNRVCGNVVGSDKRGEGTKRC
jgi:hypothetical protein